MPFVGGSGGGVWCEEGGRVRGRCGWDGGEPWGVALEFCIKGTSAKRADLKVGHYEKDAESHARTALEDPEKWLFLDTETTGLAGGTGTYAFLVGLAWWDAGGLQVEQLFLRDFSV